MTGNGTGDQDDIVLRANLNDFEVLHRAAVDTVATGHFLVLPDTTGPGACTNTTRTAVHHVTVGVWLTGEVVALHHTLESLTLGRANDVDPLAIFKESCTRVCLFGIREIRVVLETEFLDELLG